MKQFTDAQLEAIDSRVLQPRYAISILAGGTEYFITSHADIPTPDPANTMVGRVSKLATTSQNYTPEKRISTIGGFSCTVADAGKEVSNWLRALDQANVGLINARLRYYFGGKGFDWADYGAPIGTWFVSGIDHTETNYSFKAADAQRFVKKKIITLHNTTLTAALNTTDTTVSVASVDGFPLVAHGTSYTDGSAGQTVGYLYLEGDDASGVKVAEVIRYTGIVGNTFTGCTRGVLGTRAREWKGPEGNSAGHGVSEHFYLELPAPKLAWAIMTGELYGQPGATLPAHWHAGVSTQYLDLASFENIGVDLWDPTDDTKGVILPFDGIEDEDAKAFIEEEVLPLISCGLVVQGDGELALARTTGVVTDAMPNAILNEADVSTVSAFSRDLKAMRNRYLIAYSYRRTQKEYKRKHVLLDTDSFGRNGVSAEVAEYKFKGLHYTRHTVDMVRELMTGLRDRLSNEPISVTINTRLKWAMLDVADVVRLQLANWQDYTNTDAINRSFEVQQQTVNWLTGQVSLKLFGTSRRAAPLPPVVDQSLQLNNSHWPSFKSVLPAGSYTELANTLTITQNVSLVGFDNLNSGWRYQGNVVVQSGKTVTCTKNFILDAWDITWDGDLDLSGRGISGLSTDDQNAAANLGLVGGPTVRTGQPMAYHRITKFNFRETLYAVTSKQEELQPRRVNNIQISLGDNNDLIGLPSTLCGQPGVMGERVVYKKETGSTGSTIVTTSEHGVATAAVASGGGALLICNGLFGSGFINTSGKYGIQAVNHASISISAVNGTQQQADIHPSTSSGSYPGAVFVLLKQNTPAPNLREMVQATVGGSLPASMVMANPAQNKDFWRGAHTYFFKWGNNSGTAISTTQTVSAYHEAASALYANGYDLDVGEVTRVIYLTKNTGEDAQPDDKPLLDAQPVADLLLKEDINTPETPAANMSTITATVIPPADTQWAYAIIEARVLGSNAPFNPLQYKTPTESTLPLPTDGTAYEFRARSVSKDGVESVAGITRNITLTNKAAQTDKPQLTVPPIKRLQLVNAIDTGDNWNKFKSANAQFRWAKLANLSGGFSTVGGSPDMHLTGYKVRILTPAGEVLREETIETTEYTYTHEKNKTDKAGRAFVFEVRALAATGHNSEPASMLVENPAPAAPSNIKITTGFTTLAVTFDLPDDIDFIGVDVFARQGAADPFTAQPVRIAGNSFSLDDLAHNTDHTIGLRSVDQFGIGGQSSAVTVTTKRIESADINGIGNWATLTNPASLSFIQQNMANDSISGDKVVNLTVAKLTAGQVVVQIDLGTGILLDGGNGIIQTINNGYSMTMGPVDVPSESDVPLVLFASDGNDIPFWVDALGRGKFTGQLKITGGSTMGAGYLHLNAATAEIAIGATRTWQSQGIQLQYNNGSPRAYLGNGGNSFMRFSGSQFTLGAGTTIESVDAYSNNTAYKTWLGGDFARFLKRPPPIVPGEMMTATDNPETGWTLIGVPPWGGGTSYFPHRAHPSLFTFFLTGRGTAFKMKINGSGMAANQSDMIVYIGTFAAPYGQGSVGFRLMFDYSNWEWYASLHCSNSNHSYDSPWQSITQMWLDDDNEGVEFQVSFTPTEVTLTVVDNFTETLTNTMYFPTSGTWTNTNSGLIGFTVLQKGSANSSGFKVGDIKFVNYSI